MLVSKLKNNPKSRVVKKSYINIYSRLTFQEERYIRFNSKYKKYNFGWDNTLIKLLKIFRENLKRGSVILDAGCGEGNYLIDECRRKIDYAFGVDINKQVIKKNICLDKIVISDLENLPFQNDSFDIVAALWVIEHLENPKLVIKEIYRVLKPGHILIFATPNSRYFLITIKRILSFVGVDKILNMVLYGRSREGIFKTFYKVNTKEKLRSCLISSGFATFYLEENFDPGYTSYGNVSFGITKLLGSLAKNKNFSFLNAHILGWAVK